MPERIAFVIPKKSGSFGWQPGADRAKRLSWTIFATL